MGWKENNFFIVTSDNINSIKNSILYGFVLIGDTVFRNGEHNFKKEEIQNGIGSYVYVMKNDDELYFITDDAGDYVLYYFVNHNYWAVSNSFWLLSDEVKKNYELTLNREVAIHDIVAPLSSLSIEDTLINEIKCLRANETISIINGKLCMERKETNLFSVNLLDSVGLIDEWINKWIKVMKAIEKSGYTMKFDLSGGFDSRLTLAIAIAAGVDFNCENVFVNSIIPISEGQIEHMKDDFQIATQIADKLGFELNRPIKNMYSKMSVQDSVDMFSECMLSNHREAYFFDFFAREPIFHFGGHGGETLRGDVYSLEKWLRMASEDCNGYEAVSKKVLVNSYNKCLIKEFDSTKCNEFASLTNFWRETWQRYHFGQTIMYRNITNEIVFAPLSDSMIYRVQPFWKGEPIENVIYTLILKRTAPWLLDVPLSDGRKINPKALEVSEDILKGIEPRVDICDVIPLNVESMELEIDLADSEDVLSDQYFANVLFTEKNNRMFLEKFGLYGKSIWKNAEIKKLDDRLYYPNRFVTPLLAICKCLAIEEESNHLKNIYKFINDNLNMSFAAWNEYPDSDNLYLDVSKYKLLKRIIENISNNDKLIIYGMGRVGQIVAQFIVNYLPRLDIIFAETTSNIEKCFLERNVYSIRSLDVNKERALVAICTINKDYADDMIEIATTEGFDSICTLFD